MLEQVALGVKNGHIAVANSSDVVSLGIVLLGIGDVELASEVLNVKRREPRGNGRVSEGGTGERDPGPVAVVDLDGSRIEIGGIDEIRGVSEGKTFIDGARCRVVHLDDILRSLANGDQPIFCRKKPGAVDSGRDLKRRRVVVANSSRAPA